MQPQTHSDRRVIAASRFVFRQPTVSDGRAVHDLISQCPPLDRNSLYCNLLQCTHFASTCVLAEAVERNGQGSAIAGFVAAYLHPEREDTVFVWQVAVAPDARGAGLARRMLLELLTRSECVHATELETTITPSNQPSWALFESVARDLGAAWSSVPLFDRDRHLDGAHESEMLVTIGPFAARAAERAPTREN